MFKKLVLYFIALTLSGAHHSHFYRRDYTYFVDFDAFYKLHWNKHGVSWNTAFTTCDGEGAKLFYPEEEGEWEVVKNLTSGLDEELETRDVIVGIHDEIGRGEFITVDGAVTPTPVIHNHHVPTGHGCIIMDLNQVVYKTSSCDADIPTEKLFVCKKVDENKRPCPTIDLSYKFMEETKKCYKINNRSRSWQEAWHTCYMEGGMLLSLDSDAEAKIIENMITRDSNYFGGFRKIFPGSDFYTVKGKRVQESGFKRWKDKQNKDSYDDSLAMCGAIYLSDSWSAELYMTAEDCLNHLPFICEMPARS